MSYEIVKCSEQAQAVIDGKKSTYSKYPFDKLDVGESFAVPFDSVKEPSLRTTVSNHNGEKKFRVIKHINVGIFEIVRIV